MDFGMLRSLAQAPPSEGAWEELCAKLGGLQEPNEIEQILGYLDGALRRWPRELRVVPKAWRRDLVGEGNPVMRVALMADLNQASDSLLERSVERGAAGMRHLERLTLSSHGGTASSVAALLRSQGLSGLEELELRRSRHALYTYTRPAKTYEGWGELGLAIRSHERLRRFEIRDTKIMSRRDYAALLSEPLGVESLTIESSKLEAVHLAAIAVQLESGLRELDLGGNTLADEGWIELASQRLDGLRMLRLDRTKGGDEGAAALAARAMPDLEVLSCLHLDMSEVGVAAWMGAELERLLVLELDLRGSSAGLAQALASASHLGRLERVKLRFHCDDGFELCEAMAAQGTFRGVREVHLLELEPAGLEALLRSRAFEGVEALTLELVRVTDAVWDALATSEHLSGLADLTIKRSANADLATPGHLKFCEGQGLEALRRVSFEDCGWEPLRHLANMGRLGTLEGLTVRRSSVGLAWLRELFENPELERVTRFTLEANRALSEEEARLCVHPKHHPKEWSPPYAAYKTLARS